MIKDIGTEGLRAERVPKPLSIGWLGDAMIAIMIGYKRSLSVFDRSVPPAVSRINTRRHMKAVNAGELSERNIQRVT
jgi:hypothetical protein